MILMIRSMMRRKDLFPPSNLFPDAGAPVLQPEEQKEAEMLAFYRRTTGNPVKERDREAFREVAKLAVHLIRAGIMRAVLRCPTRVNSLRYCIGAIQEAARSEMGKEIVAFLEGTFDRRLQHVRPSTQ